jgi:hypothetical protein
MHGAHSGRQTLAGPVQPGPEQPNSPTRRAVWGRRAEQAAGEQLQGRGLRPLGPRLLRALARRLLRKESAWTPSRGGMKTLETELRRVLAREGRCFRGASGNAHSGGRALSLLPTLPATRLEPPRSTAPLH